MSTWIDIYLNSSDIITHNTSTNFDFTEFCVKGKMPGITYYQILVETH